MLRSLHSAIQREVARVKEALKSRALASKKSMMPTAPLPLTAKMAIRTATRMFLMLIKEARKSVQHWLHCS